MDLVLEMALLGLLARAAPQADPDGQHAVLWRLGQGSHLDLRMLPCLQPRACDWEREGWNGPGSDTCKHLRHRLRKAHSMELKSFFNSLLKPHDEVSFCDAATYIDFQT